LSEATASVVLSEALAQEAVARPASIGTWRYIPEVDGLRSVAVLAVCVFHLARGLLPGGFVGVDVFFVISGFLISSVLLQDADARRFSILHFYQHRIARIAPALFLVLAATLLAASALYSALDFASTGADAGMAAISAINVKLLLEQGGYFQASPDAQPLLHCWSLAVEEQFYLIFPPFIFVVARYVRRPVILVLALAGASFALCVLVTMRWPAFAFYMLPTRAWELLVGAALALLRRRGAVLSPGAAGAVGWPGLALIVLSFLIIRDGDGFPGWIAALPVAGAAMVLGSVGQARGLYSRLLAHPAMVFVGKRSYALYLWHWPVFSFVDYACYAWPLAPRLALKLGITVAGTLISYELVEKPARRFLNASENRILAFVAVALAAGSLVAAGAYIRVHNLLSAAPTSIASGGIVANPDGRALIVVVGDSQGVMYGTELAKIARLRDYRLNVLSGSGRDELAGEAHTLWPKVLHYLSAHPADVIIVAEKWSDKLGRDPAKLKRAIDALSPYGRRIVILTQPPFPPPEATRQAIAGGGTRIFYERSADQAARLKATAAVKALAGDNIEVVDVSPTFLGPGGQVRAIAPDGHFAYHDDAHLTDSGTALVRDQLDAAIARALKPAPPTQKVAANPVKG
jgi:peptidoglycan/LPS O-acetylase OafA/YrhL